MYIRAEHTLLRIIFLFRCGVLREMWQSCLILSPELRCEIFCSQRFYRPSCNDFIPINASTIPMERNKAGITLVTSAGTRSRARTICIITSSSSAVNCRGSTVRIVRTARNIRPTWDRIYAEYTPMRVSTFSTWGSSKTISRDERHKFCKPSFRGRSQSKATRCISKLWYQSTERPFVDLLFCLGIFYLFYIHLTFPWRSIVEKLFVICIINLYIYL